MVLSLVMCFGLLQTTTFAASWNPGDQITINVRVFDQSTGATYNVGTDYVTKGDQYIPSGERSISTVDAVDDFIDLEDLSSEDVCTINFPGVIESEVE